jgi:hypothetical protein
VPDPLRAMDGMPPGQVQVEGIRTGELSDRGCRRRPGLSAPVPWRMPQMCPKRPPGRCINPPLIDCHLTVVAATLVDVRNLLW